MTRISLFFCFFIRGKKKRGKLSNLLPKYARDAKKQDEIQLCRRGIPQLHDVDILCIKHDQPIGTFVAFSYSMIQGNQLKKRNELPNYKN